MEDLDSVKAIFVDTDILVDYLRGREPGKSAFSSWRNKAEIFMTSITAFELLLGANLSKKREQRKGEVESLLNQHEIIAFNWESASMAAEKGAELKIEGIPLEIRDLFNACICLTAKTPILTNNKAHYEKIKGLKIIMP